MAMKENNALKLLMETLQAASSITQFHLVDKREEEHIKEQFRVLAGQVTSPEWINNSPDCTELDALLFPLPARLQRAKEKRYANTVSYIIKTIQYGIGIGHRPLTQEQMREAALVRLKRRLQVEAYLDILELTEKLDQCIREKWESLIKIDNLQAAILQEQKTMDLLLSQNPYIMEDICYVLDPSQLTNDAGEYFQAKVKRDRMEKSLEEILGELTYTEQNIEEYRKRIDEQAARLKSSEAA